MSCIERPELKWVTQMGYSAGASQDIARPGPVEIGDFLVIVAANGNGGISASWPAKTGWVRALNAGSAVFADNPEAKLAVYYRFADGTEGDTETVAYAVSAPAWSIVYANFGPQVDPTTPIVFSATGILDSPAVDEIVIPAFDAPKDRLLGLILAAYGADINVLPFVLDQPRWTSIAEVVSTGATGPTSLLVATFEVTDLDFEGETLPATTVSSPTSTPDRGWIGVTAYINRRCGRSTEQILQELLKFLPPSYVEASDLLGALAAQMSRMEADGCTLFDLATVSRGVEKWLTLHGQGLGLLRGPSETDDAYRERIRSVDDRVTRPAILAAVEEILESRTAGVDTDAQMIEWFESPALGLEPFFLGTMGAALSGGPTSFTLAVEDFDNDDLFDEPEYNSIASTLTDLRAAGVRAYMGMAVGVMTAIPNRRGVLGWPLLTTLGDITSADRAGFDVLDASHYGLLDVGRLSANNVKMFALKFELTAVLSTDQVLIGSSGATGIALWLTTAGDLRLRISDGVTSVDITLAGAMPIEVGPAWWVFLQMDQRITANAVPGLVAVGRDGDANVAASQTFTPAAGVQHNAFAVETRIGHNTGGLSSSPTGGASQTRILEIREYDAEPGTTFSFTGPILGLILADLNSRWDRIDLQYDGSDQVLF